jgi:predicted NAD-dependent protein-ADP-ribosyltransferase YbiA (DUF1768 family)
MYIVYRMIFQIFILYCCCRENRVYPTADAMYMFFGKHDFLSQWHPAIFELDGIIYSCAEQYYMHQKACKYFDTHAKHNDYH